MLATLAISKNAKQRKRVANENEATLSNKFRLLDPQLQTWVNEQIKQNVRLDRPKIISKAKDLAKSFCVYDVISWSRPWCLSYVFLRLNLRSGERRVSKVVIETLAVRVVRDLARLRDLVLAHEGTSVCVDPYYSYHWDQRPQPRGVEVFTLAVAPVGMNRPLGRVHAGYRNFFSHGVLSHPASKEKPHAAAHFPRSF